MSKVEDSEKTNGDAGGGEKNKFGEPVKYDPTFHGPIKNRGCTDVICCILFIIFFLGMGVVGYWAYNEGDPITLVYPSDSEGNLCGYGDYSDKPNLIFFDLLKCISPSIVLNGCPTTQVCVKECPKKYWTYYPLLVKEQIPGIGIDQAGRAEMICKNSVNPQTTTRTISDLVDSGDCASYYVESTAVVGRCIPSAITALANKTADIVVSTAAGNGTLQTAGGQNVTGQGLSDASYWLSKFLNAKEYGEKILSDVRTSWWMILIGLGIACVWAFIWIVIMRWVAGPMVWITIIAFIALFGFACYYTFTKYLELKDNPDANGNFEFTTNLSYYTQLSTTWLVLGIISAVVLGITLILLIFLRKRILIAIALIKEASRAIGNMMFTLLWPIIPFILQVILFGYWGATAIFLASSGTKIYSANSTNITTGDTGNLIKDACPTNISTGLDSFCGFLKYDVQEYTIYLQFYMLFMLFWVMNFIVALGQMTLAGAFASFYWAFSKPEDIPAFPVTGSLWRSFRYHLGSLAFGSLLVAIIQMIRVILEYIDHKLKGSENQVAKFILKCLKCFFWCLEKCMKFLNKNAYILIAVYGKNFCTSAKNAFFLIMRNIVRVAVVDKVTDFLLLISKLVVVAAVTSAAFFFFDGRISFLANYTPSLNYYLVPVIIIAIGSYIIAACFFSVYSMGVDTLFLCFLEDLERHDGSVEKPYYMNKELKSILGKKNKVEKED